VIFVSFFLSIKSEFLQLVQVCDKLSCVLLVVASGDDETAAADTSMFTGCRLS